MKFSTFIIILSGFVVIMLEMILMNFATVLGAFRISIIGVIVLLVRRQVGASALFGLTCSFVADIMSGSLFGVHMIAFVVVFSLLVALLNRFITHQSFLGHMALGITGIGLSRFFVDIFSGLLTANLSVIKLLQLSPSWFIELLFSSMLLIIILLFLSASFKELRVSSPSYK